MYLQTAAELFWYRGNVFPFPEYEILLNGESLGIFDNSSSYFDETLTAGSSYTYSVITITDNGERSEAATINVQSYPTAADNGISMVNSLNDNDAIPAGLRLLAPAM